MCGSIRKATPVDMDSIEEMYNEHFAYENEYGAFTVFKKGVYPTRRDAEKAVRAGTLYVYDECGSIVGSVILDENQPKEYEGVVWGLSLTRNEAMVIHLLMVRPSSKGKGIATALMKYATELARERSCKALRLDTGSRNIPAVSLYQKLGFQIVATASMRVGGTIEHSGHLFLEKML